MISKTNKAVLTVALVAFVVLSASVILLPGDETDAYEADTVAVIGDTEYSTVAAAISAATGGTEVTVKLVADSTGSITIPNGKSIILDLAGKKLTNTADSDTITVENGGRLTIQGTGTVDNVSHTKACIRNTVGGTVVLNGGDYTRSMEAGTFNPDNANGNSWYNIVNFGTMTINDGVRVISTGGFSSLMENGFASNRWTGYGSTATMTINGGYFSGGKNSMKNDECGSVEINGGTFLNTANATFINWNTATINGGTFDKTGSSSSVVSNGSYGTYGVGELTINGGSFIGSTMFGILEDDTAQGGIEVKGGVFDADPTGTRVTIPQGFTKALINDRYYVGAQTTADSTGTIVSDGNSVVADVETPSTVVKVQDGTVSIIGDSVLGAISVSVEERTENFIQAPEAIASFDIVIATSANYVADITVNATIMSGHQALVYYIDEDGELVPVEVVDFTSSTVTFRTTHNTPFVVMSEPVQETPPTPGDEDDYPFLPGNGNVSSSNGGSSDSTKLVAAAAAVIVIMLAAVAMMMVKKN